MKYFVLTAGLRSYLRQALHKPQRITRMTVRAYDDDWDDGDDDQPVFDTNYSQWTSPNGQHFMPASKTVAQLPPGVYEIDRTQAGIYFEAIPVKTEGLIKFPETNSNRVLSEIQKFWERESLFRDYDLSYKRGIMLYGPPGSGKSCTVQLVMHDVVKRGGVVLQFNEPFLFIDGLRILRTIQPDTPVVAIIEDIDDLLQHYKESQILNILDGVECVNKVVFLATTNYPEKLGHRIMNRPSRFDKRFRIGFPSEKSRRLYFETLIGEEKIKSLGIDIARWVKDTDKLSIAHLKELFVAVVILGDDYKAAVKTLRTMKEEVDDKDFEGHLGFSASEDGEVYD